MKTENITNEIEIFSLFEHRITGNGEVGDQKIDFCCAPTTGSYVIFYLRTNGGPVPVTIYNPNINEWFWDTDAFGLAGLSVDETLTLIRDIKSWNQRENQFDDGELEDFWSAAEQYEADHE